MTLLALATLAAGGAGSAPVRSQAYRTCIAQSGGRDAAFRLCAADEATRADRALNVAYARRIGAASAAKRRALRVAERRWIVRRETDCRARYRAELPGQDAGAGYQLCMADAANARTGILLQYR